MGILKRFFLSLFLGKRVYRSLAAVIFLFILSYLIPFLFDIAVLALGLLVCLVVLDWLVLYTKRNPVLVTRILPDKMSNGDGNIIYWQISNHYNFRSRFQNEHAAESGRKHKTPIYCLPQGAR